MRVCCCECVRVQDGLLCILPFFAVYTPVTVFVRMFSARRWPQLRRAVRYSATPALRTVPDAVVAAAVGCMSDACVNLPKRFMC